jgi:hypothetical protein
MKEGREEGRKGGRTDERKENEGNKKGWTERRLHSCRTPILKLTTTCGWVIVEKGEGGTGRKEGRMERTRAREKAEQDRTGRPLASC